MQEANIHFHQGSDYDYIDFPERFENLKTNPASQTGFTINPKTGAEVDDYSWRLDRPQMWDRAIRHFAVDEGADLVIVHHPHIIQGVEVYNSKLIAHSLGNFIFDLNYPETYPSMILNVNFNQNGLVHSTILPLYIDDYLTKPANGELGNYILDYMAMKSKGLNTYVHVDTDNQIATVIMDSSNLEEQYISYNILSFDKKITQINGDTFLRWEPIKINGPGSISEIVSGDPLISHFRVGREKIWMNNFESEGSSLWNLNSESEILQDSVFRRGSIGLLHKRNSDSPSNIVTNLEDRLPFQNDFSHSLHGYIKTVNSKNVTLEARYFDNRSGESLFTASIQDSINGNTNWRKYWDEIPKIESAEFVNIRMNSDIPDSGESFSFFDDVGLIEWDSIQSVSSYPISIINPNDYQYIQFFSTDTNENVIESVVKNTIIGELGPLTSLPMTTASTITVPGYFYFFENSKGPVGQREWSFQSNIFSEISSPKLFVDIPGVYQVSLKVVGPLGEEDINTISVIALAEGTQQHGYGDVNGDGTITAVDVLLAANYTIGLMEFEPVEFLAADIDGSGLIDIFDVLQISDLTGL
ncbi:MAG: CapA family protein [Candidatus Neomarinimicrobiota bacterium]